MQSALKPQTVLRASCEPCRKAKVCRKVNLLLFVLTVVFYLRCDASEKARVVRGASSERRNARFCPPSGSESSRDNPNHIAIPSMR
jgi:hypothetical protein